jgi:hypothetical protein
VPILLTLLERLVAADGYRPRRRPGRCIASCPVGIDITEEAAALAAEQREG